MNNRIKVEKILTPPLLPTLIVGLRKTYLKSFTLTITKKDPT